MLQRCRLLCSISVLILTGCGAAEVVDISVADHADPLTGDGKDNLFTLMLTRASAGYDTSKLSVVVGVAGQTATVVNFTHNDTNSNGLLDQGESLLCKEPGLNLFDASIDGKSVSVTLDETTSASRLTVLGGATWLAH